MPQYYTKRGRENVKNELFLLSNKNVLNNYPLVPTSQNRITLRNKCNDTNLVWLGGTVHSIDGLDSVDDEDDTDDDEDFYNDAEDDCHDDDDNDDKR